MAHPTQGCQSSHHWNGSLMSLPIRKGCENLLRRFVKIYDHRLNIAFDYGEVDHQCASGGNTQKGRAQCHHCAGDDRDQGHLGFRISLPGNTGNSVNSVESSISVYHYILLGVFHFHVDDSLAECIGRVDARFTKSKILQTRGILNVTFKVCLVMFG